MAKRKPAKWSAKWSAKLPPAAFDYFREQGAKGGAIGGKRRFAALSDAEKTALAKKAALARWGKKKRPT